MQKTKPLIKGSGKVEIWEEEKNLEALLWGIITTQNEWKRLA